MFERLITPLRARFEPSPLPEASFEVIEDHETASAENFARDVLIEIMRNSVESLKEAEDLKAKIEVMGEIQRIMVEDACTKDVFRELDGYLLIINVLAILHVYLEMEESGTTQTEEGERLAFMLLAESLSGHTANQRYFEKHVGYESVGRALAALINDPRTVDQTFGFILSVALNNFALSGLFKMLRAAESVDFSEHKALLGTIKHPLAFSLLVSLLLDLPPDDDYLPMAVFALTETLVNLNHRNKVLLSNMPLVRPVFQRFLDSESKRKPVLQKLLKRLLDIGAPVSDVRLLFQHAVRDEKALDSDVLDIIRSGMRAKWPQHFSMEGPAALQVRDENIKGLPSSGFTFMLWLWIERLPQGSSQALFRVWSNSRVLFQLSLRLDGVLEVVSSGNSEMAVLQHAKIAKGRWTHLTLIHHPHRASNPTIRVFLDGVLHDSRNWAYPRIDSTQQTIMYTTGDFNIPEESGMSWCLASAYLFSLPIPDDLPRLIQHLGPRYAAHFQARDLVRFLTYEAATSLNIFLTNLVTQRSGRHAQSVTLTAAGLSPLMRAIKDGMGISEDNILFSVSPHGSVADSEQLNVVGYANAYIRNGVACVGASSRAKVEMLGDVVSVTQRGLDIALWSIGGSPIALRLIELASTPHELSRALSIFTDGARASWQMSEDMERLHAFDILAHILKAKSQLINVTAYETLFEFLGLNFKCPDHSVIMNSLAYRALALDFEIWANTRQDIQKIHLDHFEILLKTSKYRIFNTKQRLGKFACIRKMLFVLQTSWYGQDMVANLVTALKVIAQACFSADETIKPIVSYLAANLHEGSAQASSPRSIMSKYDRAYPHAKAELVLESLVSILHSPSHFAKFSAALPLTRICILLLGDRPSPTVAAQVLTIVGLALKSSTSFTRKFELVSGWTVLKATLPGAWDATVQSVAFDVLFGRVGQNPTHQSQRISSVSCPYVVPAIIAALDRGLTAIAQGSFDEEALNMEGFVEPLIEELMTFQSTSSSFRQIFRSQQTTALLIGAYSAFVSNGFSVQINRRNYVRILEKMNHFILSFTLDKVVSGSQRQEMLDILQKAEVLLSAEQLEDASGWNSDQQMTRSISSGQSNAQLLGERAYQKTTSRIRDWRQNIIASEKKRLWRTALDLRENRRNAAETNEWKNSLYDDRGLWTPNKALWSWMLDETEGPGRIRKKLERKYEVSTSSIEQDAARIVSEPDADAQSFIQVEAPPWAESYDLHPADVEGEQEWLDEFSDDKLRRVRHELQIGDVIQAVCTVTRIVGIDSSPGLLILGRSHLYMLDGLVENTDGEVIDARDAPKNLFSVPGSLLELDGKQRARHWTYEKVASFSRKTCLFRDVALEIYFRDSRSLLIVFPTKRKRQDMADKLSTAIEAKTVVHSRSPLLRRTPMLGKMSAKVLSGFRDELSTAQRKWQAREISNFTYLGILNQTSGRTPGDATQYPIFPWILSDYESDRLDLFSASTFRDLTRPMGALTEGRREAARQRYSNLQSVGEMPFHYGTHFSSSMIVCHFLIRLEPFTHMFKTLQGGDWDLPDRLFSDVARSYHSASRDLRGDVRELIPEFFTSLEFLQNSANLDFGVQQSTGEKIHNVKLPPWAKNDPFLFITEHRRALESDFVSENLPAWIDLIWGYKQRDADSLNVFHPYSYEGSIDLDNIKDEVEREATVGIIHNFGQTPRKLFDVPHPPRLMHGPTTLPLGTQFGIEEDSHLLVQSSRPVSEIFTPIATLVVDMISERVIPCPYGTLYSPQYPHESIGWDFIDETIKLSVDRKVVQVAEAISCQCAVFVDADLLVTGSSDAMLRLWRLNRKDGVTAMLQTHILRAHANCIICVAACRAWSIIVSGSDDGTAVIWDLNRAVYVRSIYHRDADASIAEDSRVHLVAINDSTGYIASCSTKKLCIHTINAHRIVELDLALVHPADGVITSLAFHEREYSRHGILATGTSTGAIQLRTWTAADTPTGEDAQWKFLTLRTLQCREGPDGRTTNAITALQFVGESLFHGDEIGKVFVWELPE